MNPQEYAESVNKNIRDSAERQRSINRGEISPQSLQDQRAGGDPTVQAHQETLRQREAQKTFEPYVTNERFLELLDAITEDRKKDHARIKAMHEGMVDMQKHIEILESLVITKDMVPPQPEKKRKSKMKRNEDGEAAFS